ncbi:MAG TPA: creatininase family protein [Candidatus Eremiobacteraeota bacterium]|nr:creatininase family protein [Candidatus Eremiobacteraeota bacterium]
MELLEMTWQEIEKYLESRKSIIIPLGSIEQHGLALPLGTDTYIAEKIALEVGKRTFTIVLPCIRPGLSLVPHMAFSGTVSLRPETIQKVIEDTVKSLYLHRFRQFLIINAHGLNDAGIISAFQNLCYDLEGIRYYSAAWWDLKKVQSLRKVYFSSSGHATAEEVSIMLYLNEKLVKKELLTIHHPPHNYFTTLEKIKNYTSTGLINGDQREADKELGRQLFQEAVNGYIQILNEIMV